MRSCGGVGPRFHNLWYDATGTRNRDVVSNHMGFRVRRLIREGFRSTSTQWLICRNRVPICLRSAGPMCARARQRTPTMCLH